MKTYWLLLSKSFWLWRERITIKAKDKSDAFDNLNIPWYVINYNHIANMDNENDKLRAKIYQFWDLKFDICDNQIIIILHKGKEVIESTKINILSSDRWILSNENIEKINKIRSNYNEWMDSIVYKWFTNYYDIKNNELRNYIIKDL